MTLKISTHSSTHNNLHNSHNIPVWKLMREDLRRRTWMTALSCLASFMASPVAFLFMNSLSVSPLSQARMNAAMEQGADVVAGEITSHFLEYFTTVHLVFQMAILAVAALIAAVCGFQYLYSRRMVDLYHSAPASRGRLFLAIWLNGFLIWLVPAVLGQISVCILSLYYIGSPSFWSSVALLLVKELGLFVLCFLIVYHACLVVVMVSGNAKNAGVNLFIYGLGVIALYSTAYAYMNSYLDTFYLPDDWIYAPPVVALSPLAAPVFLCIRFLTHIPGCFPTGMESMDALQWHRIVLPSVVVMLANFGLAMYLHKKRPSELAERGVENKYFRIPLNFVTSVFCGLWLSLFFGLIPDDRSLKWALFGAVFGSVLAFACMNILHHTSFKALFSHKLQLAITLGFTCCVLFVFHYDAFGYDTYLPEKDSITGLSLYSSAFCGEGFELQETADGTYTNFYDVKFSGNTIFTDREQNYRLLETLVDTNNYHPEENGHSYSLSVKVNTTRGSYHRRYTFRTAGTVMEALQPFAESDAFQEYFHPAACAVMKAPVHIDIHPIAGETLGLKDPEQIEQLRQAYAQDFNEHFSSGSPITRSNTNQMFSMNYAYPKSDTDISDIIRPSDFTGNIKYHHPGMNVPVWYERTLSLLRKWYPEYIWSQDDMDLMSVSVNISGSAGETLPDLLEYLGSAKVETTDRSGAIDKTQKYGSWTRQIDAPEEIAALKPYLYIGRYNSSEFIQIGKVEMTLPSNLTPEIKQDSEQSSEQNSKYTQTCNCYLKRGEIGRAHV